MNRQYSIYRIYKYNEVWFVAGHVATYATEVAAYRAVLEELQADDINSNIISNINENKFVTLWYRLNTKTRAYEFNHLENGIAASLYMPSIKHPNHKYTWKSSTWMSILGYITPDYIVHAFN